MRVKFGILGLAIIGLTGLAMRQLPWLSSFGSSHYLEPHFANPLMQMGGCLCFVYLIWCFKQLSLLASAPIIEPGQSLADVTSAEATRCIVSFFAATILFMVSLVWVMTQIGWLIEQRFAR